MGLLSELFLLLLLAALLTISDSKPSPGGAAPGRSGDFCVSPRHEPPGGCPLLLHPRGVGMLSHFSARAAHHWDSQRRRFPITRGCRGWGYEHGSPGNSALTPGCPAADRLCLPLLPTREGNHLAKATSARIKSQRLETTPIKLCCLHNGEVCPSHITGRYLLAAQRCRSIAPHLSAKLKDSFPQLSRVP